MAQVLMGIAAVILFIGLAVASVSFLSDSFVTRVAMTYSADLLSKLSAVNAASTMRRQSRMLDVTRSDVMGSPPLLVTEGYLDSMPIASNTLNTTPDPISVMGGSLSTLPNSVVIGYYYRVANDDRGNDMCQQLNETVSLSTPTATTPANFLTTVQSSRVGCLIVSGTGLVAHGLNNNDRVIWQLMD